MVVLDRRSTESAVSRMVHTRHMDMRYVLTKLARSRWPDIGKVFFPAFLWTETTIKTKKKKKKKKTRPMSSNLDRASLVNKGFIISPKDYIKSFRFCGNK